MNDEVGKELEERAKHIENSNFNKNIIQEQDEMLQDVIKSANSTKAVVQIMSDSETQGKITKVTIGVSRLFGYNEEELIGRKVTILMPPPYNKHHDNLILRYQ